MILASNRLPVNVTTNKKGELHLKPSSGGLVSAISGLAGMESFSWVGWIGSDAPEKEHGKIQKALKKHQFHPVFLNNEETENFYNGACNQVIWPNFHYLPGNFYKLLDYWNAYEAINQKFADTILKVYKKGDLVWVHDFHLMLVPQMLRQARPDIRVGFFLHIPFPSSEVFRILPMRNAILKGLLNCDLIGFQSYNHLRHFKSACSRILGLEFTSIEEINYEGRQVKAGVFPVGIDFSRFQKALKKPSVIKRIKELKKTFAGKKIIIGVDRLDYIKGLSLKLEAFKLFLKKYPEQRDKVVLFQIGIPTRDEVPDFQQVKQEVDQLVGEINGLFGTPDHTPINYIGRTVSFEELAALYNISDIQLNTSIRDGMNLVCMEYIACHKNQEGAVLISEFTGASQSLASATIINPWNINETADALYAALIQTPKESKDNMDSLFEFVSHHSSVDWGRKYLEKLNSTNDEYTQTKILKRTARNKLFKKFQEAENRLLFLDYDGTLSHFQNNPKLAKPQDKLITTLKNLSKIPNTQVFIISGRDRQTLDLWFNDLSIGLVAEHGFCYKLAQSKLWVTQGHNYIPQYKKEILDIFKDYIMRTPGSFAEIKDTAIAWHYRLTDPEFGSWQSKEIFSQLQTMLANLPLEVLSGNKVIEVRNSGINKGSFITNLFHSHILSKLSFILCIGDDRTDEDMFHSLNKRQWTFRVGSKESQANYFLKSVDETVELLESLHNSLPVKA